MYFVIDAAVDFAVDVDFVFDVTSSPLESGGTLGGYNVRGVAEMEVI